MSSGRQGSATKAGGTRVYDLAHTRSGDKGNASNVAVIAYDDAGWQRIRRDLTAERVMAAYAHLAEGPVTRYELPNLKALNFVIEKALAGGVTRSLRIDPHGKTLSSVMLTITLPDVPEGEGGAAGPAE